MIQISFKKVTKLNHKTKCYSLKLLIYSLLVVFSRLLPYMPFDRLSMHHKTNAYYFSQCHWFYIKMNSKYRDLPGIMSVITENKNSSLGFNTITQPRILTINYSTICQTNVPFPGKSEIN